MGRLVRVLRHVDHERKPAMGYIYEAMDRAKEGIKASFNDKEEKYKEVFEIIKRRCECQLHHPLHAAGHFLNLDIFYKNSAATESDTEVKRGLYSCIERLNRGEGEQDQISDELVKYKSGECLFGIGFAVRARDTFSPAMWWSNYGSRTPHLQKFAIKILSLTCSSSRCERNWSVEHIHSKKRSKLEHQKLQDSVYIKYNQALAHRFDSRDVIDPIIIDDIIGSNEWLVGQMRDDGEDIEAGDDLPFEDHTLNKENVGNVAGVSEPIIYTRRRGREAPTPAPTHVASSSRVRGMEVDEGDFEEDDGVHKNVEDAIDLSGSDKEEDLFLEDGD